MDKEENKDVKKNLDEILITSNEALEFLTGNPQLFSIPNNEAHLLNNLDEYYLRSTQRVNPTPNQQASRDERPTLEKDDTVLKARNFDHILLKPTNDEASQNKGRPQRTRPDVISKCEALKPKDGPLHLNMHLVDVEESYRCKTDDGMFETKSRRKAKLFLRGDNVILVASGAAKKRTSEQMNYEGT